MSSHNPFIPSRFGHPSFNPVNQKSRSTSLGGQKSGHRTPGSHHLEGSKSSRKKQKHDDKISIQPVEEEDGDEFFNKHLAAARFNRNHRLIHELFSDYTVTDCKSKQAPDRVQLLRKQAQTLSGHQKKLETELAQIHEKFYAKKSRILSDSKRFNDELLSLQMKTKQELMAIKPNNQTPTPPATTPNSTPTPTPTPT